MDHPLSTLHCQLYRREKQRAFQLELELQLFPGELLALTGPSGSGKTTVLRILAGLEASAKGRLVFQDEVWQDSARQIFVPPQKRSIGVVFQDYALFPHLSVRQNLLFALAPGQSLALVEELLDMMDLRELQSAYPQELSGGQQQRLALARALVRRPKLLLLDEPLSALDAQMRTHLQTYIRELHDRYQLTTLLISHQPEEIQRLAERVLVLEKGKIVQEYRPSATAEQGWVLQAYWQGAQDGFVYVQLGENQLKAPLSTTQLPPHLAVGQKIWIRLRSPQDFEVLDVQNNA
jgi:molybdate transport system ATP-binding protein